MVPQPAALASRGGIPRLLVGSWQCLALGTSHRAAQGPERGGGDPESRPMPRCERHDTISFFVDPANAMYCAQLLPQLQALLSKTTSCSLLTADSSVLAAHCAHCLLLTAYYSYRAGAALEDQGRGQRAGSHADQARIVHAPCVHHAYTVLTPCVHRTHHARHTTHTMRSTMYHHAPGELRAGRPAARRLHQRNVHRNVRGQGARGGCLWWR